MNSNKIIIFSLIFILIIALGLIGLKFFSGQVGEDKEVIVESPRPGQTVESPFLLKGKARGNWFFEASFPVRLLDNKGEEILVQPIQAIGEWMTADFVPFEQLIEYHTAATASATLVLQNDNPSGLPKKQKQFTVPVIISPSQIK